MGPNAENFKGPFEPEKLKDQLLWHSNCKEIRSIETIYEQVGILGQVLDGDYGLKCEDQRVIQCSLKAKILSQYYTVICR